MNEQRAVIQQMVDALDHADELLGGNDTLVMNGAAAGRWLLEQPAPVQEPVAQALSRDAVLANIAGWLRHLADDVTIPYFTNGAFKADCNEAADVLLTPPASEPDYAWPTIEDYEKEVGFEVNDAFKAAWTMARTTNDLFNQMGENT
jgi:hypothetical protein